MAVFRLMVERHMDPEARQLWRLERLIDVVYAVGLVVVVASLPDAATWPASLADFRTAFVEGVGLAVLGLVVLLIYWTQNNRLFRRLVRTDNRHAALSILQVFFVLLYLYSVEAVTLLPERTGPRVFQSAMVALVGFSAAWGWWYATSRRRLLAENVEENEVRGLQVGVLAEPLTALVTIPFAFVSTGVWELSWLSYLLIAPILKKRLRTRE